MSSRWTILVVILVSSVALAGCLNDFDETRLNHLRISGIDVSAPHVGSGTVTLLVNVTLDNAMAKSGEVLLRVKAYNTATGLLVKTLEEQVGTMRADRTETVPVALDLPKQDGYRITVEASQDDRRVQTASVKVTEIAALDRTISDTGLRVTTLEFLVRNVTGDKVRIDTQVYLTNQGAAESETLRLQLKAREVSTGLLAAEEWTDVAAIPPEATRISTAALQVPDAYNYLVEAVLWDGDLIVGRGEGKVQLLPTFTVPKDEEVVVKRPVVEDFQHRGDGVDWANGAESDAEGSPAPAALLLLTTLALLVTWIRRRN